MPSGFACEESIDLYISLDNQAKVSYLWYFRPLAAGKKQKWPQQSFQIILVNVC